MRLTRARAETSNRLAVVFSGPHPLTGMGAFLFSGSVTLALYVVTESEPAGVHPVKRLVLWLLTPPCGTAARDIIGVTFLGQGVIRIIDGRLFSTTALAYGSSELYGLVQVCLALAVILTRRRRTRFVGKCAAAFACAFCGWLVYAVWAASATSAFGALVLAWAMFLETRAWVMAGECNE